MTDRRHAALLGLLLLPAWLGCSTKIPPPPARLSGAGSVALLCRREGLGVPLSNCDVDAASPGSLHAMLIGRDLGEVAVLNIRSDSYIDTIASIPGTTHIPVGDAPADIAVSTDGRWAYVLDAGTADVSFVDPGGLCEAGRLPLSGRPGAMILDPAGVLYVAYPDEQQVAVIDVADCDARPGVCSPGLPHEVVRTILEGYTAVGAARSPCTDGIDNDGDGLVDIADPGCADDADVDEGDASAGATRCSDGLDNDGDGLADLGDPGCARASADSELDEHYPTPADPTRLPKCMNGLDDDEDGRFDFPDDPGCDRAGDDDERPEVAACADGEDNDGDGLADGDDPGCSSAADEQEVGCDDGKRIDVGGTPSSMALSPGGRRLFVGYSNASQVSVVDLLAGTIGELLGASEACSDGIDNDGDGFIDYPGDPECERAADNDEARGYLAPACSDGLDNDGNGRADWPDDPGCHGAGDPVELSYPERPACHDGQDNDGDGLVDLADPGCRFEDDPDERDPDPRTLNQPACNDGVDNDEDGVSDLDDSGCAAAGDDTEGDAPGEEVGPCVILAPLADPGDSNGDGCHGPGDLRALAPGAPLMGDGAGTSVTAPCSNGLDDDGDGLVDSPDDPDCAGPAGSDEFSAHPRALPDPYANPPTLAAECGDGIDNDGDGLVDRDDPGCYDPTDPTEAERSLAPDCHNGSDDDGDGLTDLEDPGCHGRADDSEEDRAPGDRQPNCGDGIDNDRDGATDLGEDPDCQGLGSFERTSPAAGVTDLAVSPDGAELYVLLQGSSSVRVVALPDGGLVDTRTREPFERALGIPVAAPALRVRFLCFQGDQPERCRAASPDVLAVVGTGEGIVSVLDIRRERQAVRGPLDRQARLRTVVDAVFAVTPEDDTFSTTGEELPTEVPLTGLHLGTFAGDAAHGVLVSSDRGLNPVTGLDTGVEGAPGGTWNAIWEGVLPSATGDHGRFELTAEGLNLVDEDSNFCRAGLEVGDHLVLRSGIDGGLSDEEQARCEEAYGREALEDREGPEWCITAVTKTSLALAPLPRSQPARPGPEGAPCPQPSDDDDVLDPLPKGEADLGVCFRELVEHEVRASGHFVVSRGSAPTNRIARGEQCDLRRDANPARESRAWMGLPFANTDLGFTLFPPPAPKEPLARGTRVSVRLVPGVEARDVNIGNVADGIAIDPTRGRAYVSDAGLNALWIVNPAAGSAAALGR